jgi:hypothetical protein
MVHRPRSGDGPRLGVAEEHGIAIPQSGLATASSNDAQSAQVQVNAEIVVGVLARVFVAYALHCSR